MEWAPKFAPPWSWFYPISHSVVARCTVLIPLIGYLIIFNENVVKYLNLVSMLGVPVPQGQVSLRLMLVYFGLSFIAFGITIYSWFCPNEPKYYGSANAYVGGVQDSVNKYSMNHIENEVANSELQERFWVIRDSFRMTSKDDADKAALRNGLLHLFYELKNYSHPDARRWVGLLYLIGFGLLSLPSGEVFLRVAWNLAKRLLGTLASA